MSYYGNAWEMQVSKGKAQKYLNGKPLPRMGYEMEITSKRDDYGFTCRLCVLNVSGIYYVASSNVERKYWPEFFRFTLDSVKGVTQ